MKTPIKFLALTLGLLALSGCDKKADDAPAPTPTEKAQTPEAPTPAPAAPTPAPAVDDHAGHDHAAGDHAGHDHGDHAKAAGGGVMFAFPDDGSRVYEDFPIAFLVRGKILAAAGDGNDDPNKGHVQVIIDSQPTPKGEVAKADATHIHYDKGEAHAMLKLAPGKHTVTLQMVDGAHRSFGPEWSKTINVEVLPNPTTPPKVTFLAPADGAKVKSPVAVKFGLEGLTIRPAGEDLKDFTSGHHHLIIDGEPSPPGIAVPADATHIHYGKGQTEAEIELSPGEHTLIMQFADGAHRAYGDHLTAKIKVTVE